MYKGVKTLCDDNKNVVTVFQVLKLSSLDARNKLNCPLIYFSCLLLGFG
jgi:hypothetical protein